MKCPHCSNTNGEYISYGRPIIKEDSILVVKHFCLKCSKEFYAEWHKVNVVKTWEGFGNENNF